MYLAFIDESGTIQEENPQINYYVLIAEVMQDYLCFVFLFFLTATAIS